MGQVTGALKQLALDIAELHDVRQQRQQQRNRVPAERHVGRTASIKRRSTARRQSLTSNQHWS